MFHVECDFLKIAMFILFIILYIMFYITSHIVNLTVSN